MKRRIALVLALILIITAFSSCSEEKAAEIYYPVNEDFLSIDPQIVSDSSSKTVAYNCYEGLTRIDENGKVAAAGADSWNVTNNSLTYVFHLRQDAKWYLTNTSKEELSDVGDTKPALPENFDERVTAADYVYGLQRGVDPNTNAPDGFYLASIKNAQDILDGKKQPSELGVTATDDYTLTVNLAYPDPDFLYYMSRLVSMPCKKDFFDACRGRYGLAMEYTICNGIYMVYRWTAGSLIRLEKNSRYTGPAKAINDRVWVYYIKSEEDISDKIKDGTYDAGYISAAEISKFSEKKFDISSIDNVIWGYWFNTKNEIFSVSDMRKAFVASTDKSFLSLPAFISGETDRLLTNILSPYYEFTPAAVKYDEKAANNSYKKAIDENDALPSSITVTVLTSEEFSESVIKQIQVWQKIFGIDVKIRTETKEDALALFESGDYQIAFLPVTVKSSGISEFFRTFTQASADNITGYSDKSYENLVNSVTYSMTQEQKTEIYKRCEQKIITDAVAVPAFTEATYFVPAKGTTGIYIYSDKEVYFRNAVAS